MASWLDRYRNPITVVLAALLAAAIVTLVLDRRDEQALEIRLGEPTPGGPDPHARPMPAAAHFRRRMSAAHG